MACGRGEDRRPLLRREERIHLDRRDRRHRPRSGGRDFGAAVHQPAAALHPVCAGGICLLDRRRRLEGRHSVVWTHPMKTILLRMLIAVVLATAAWLSWSESKLAARVAEAKQA